MKAEEERKSVEGEGSQGVEEKRRKVEEERPSGGKPARAPWWRVREVKDADRVAKRLKEEADRAQKVAEEKRKALVSVPVPGSSGPSAPGPSGASCAGSGRGGPRGRGASVAAPRGGRGFRGAGRGRGAGPSFPQRGSFRQPTTFPRVPHSTPRHSISPICYPQPRMHAPVPQQPLLTSAPPPAPASLFVDVIDIISWRVGPSKPGGFVIVVWWGGGEPSCAVSGGGFGAGCDPAGSCAGALPGARLSRRGW